MIKILLAILLIIIVAAFAPTLGFLLFVLAVGYALISIFPVATVGLGVFFLVALVLCLGNG